MEEVINFFREIIEDFKFFIEAIIAVSTVIGIIHIYREFRIKRHLELKIGRQILKYYISSRGQNIDPCNNEEIGTASEYSITEELIPFFINKVFENEITNQYYIVLGDSGMGKTTFMTQLYKKYKKKILKSFDIEIIPLFRASCLDLIDRIATPQTTILLLDGLDENRLATQNYEEFIDELLNRVENFQKVIITCRTQFFPNEQHEPYETGRIQFNTLQKKNNFYKLYMSPFNDSEIERYIYKKYPFFWRKDKREVAKNVINKCPYLMVRPMLLSYIDELIINNDDYKYMYQIYERLVINWFKREAINYYNLSRFTERTALEMYKNGDIYISSSQIAKICKRYQINLTEIEAKSKSLLNRNGNGDYKFAHKSIYEFVLAKKAFKSIKFRLQHDFSNLNMAATFWEEMQEKYVLDILENKFVSGDFTRMEIKGKDITEKFFKESTFIQTKFSDCTFLNCTFDNNVFDSCQFSSCQFKRVIMNKEKEVNITFDNCIIVSSHFQEAYLCSCIFSNTNIISCDFSDSFMIDCAFDNIIMDSIKYEGLVTDDTTLEFFKMDAEN